MRVFQTEVRQMEKTASEIVKVKKKVRKCGIDSRMKKSRLPEKIERILDHYKELEWIKDFKITEREIEIITF